MWKGSFDFSSSVTEMMWSSQRYVRKYIKNYISTWKTNSAAHSGSIRPVPRAAVRHNLLKDAASTLALCSFECEKRFSQGVQAASNFCTTGSTWQMWVWKLFSTKTCSCAEKQAAYQNLCPRVPLILLLFLLMDCVVLSPNFWSLWFGNCSNVVDLWTLYPIYCPKAGCV